MLNLTYRAYVRNRPKFYRLARRKRWAKKPRMLSFLPSKTSRNRKRSSAYASGASTSREVPRTSVLTKRKHEPEYIPFTERFFRKYPKFTEAGIKTADYIWDNGLRNIVRGHLRARQRGQRVGRSEL